MLPEAQEIMGRENMALKYFLTLADWETLSEQGIYVDVVSLANGELRLYVGSGTRCQRRPGEAMVPIQPCEGNGIDKQF